MNTTSNQYQAQFEGSIEQGCSGLYIVIDLWNDYEEVTGPMEYAAASAYARSLNGN